MFIKKKKRKEKERTGPASSPAQGQRPKVSSLIISWEPGGSNLHWTEAGSSHGAPAAGAEAAMGGEVMCAHLNLIVSSYLFKSFFFLYMKLTMTQTSLKLWIEYALHGACFDHVYYWLLLWRWNHLLKINLHGDVLKNWHLSYLFC